MAGETDSKYPQEYLGDGVYASFDGWSVWLAVNHHTNRVVALEPEVLHALSVYTRRIAQIVSAQREEADNERDNSRLPDGQTD